MINYIFIFILIFTILIYILFKLLKLNPIQKKNKFKLYSVYSIFFIFSFVIVSITYNFLGSPNLTKTELEKIKLEKLAIKTKKLEKVKNTVKEIKSLKKMLSNMPNDLNILLALASKSAIINDIDTEIDSLEKILKIKSLTKVESLLAQAYLRKNDGIVNLKLKNLINKILSKEPKDLGSNYILGLYYNQNGEFKKSQKLLFSIYQSLDKDNPWKQVYKDLINFK